jgi:hypothetical protein
MKQAEDTKTIDMFEGNKMNTSELTGTALDWAVAEAEGFFKTKMASITDGKVDVFYFESYTPSTNWALSGEIIESERLSITPRNGYWEAYYHDNLFQNDGSDYFQIGTTPLIAAMRCYVASKLGDSVQLPEELK